MAYKPGEEIELDLEGVTDRRFFVSAMNWAEQKEYEKLADRAKDEENQTVETEDLLKAIHSRITRTDPPIGPELADLEQVVDFTMIWKLHGAIKFNVTVEEKKS